MRRTEKKIRERRVVEELLESCAVGRLATVGEDGAPRIKPLNFSYREGRIYFHTALEGEKIEDIRRDERVCFEVDVAVAYVKARKQPCEADYLFRSVVVKGKARLVEDEAERVLALDLLMGKYQPEGGWGAYPPSKLAVVGVVRIDVDEMTGKEHLRDGPLREAALEALRQGLSLPLALERG